MEQSTFEQRQETIRQATHEAFEATVKALRVATDYCEIDSLCKALAELRKTRARDSHTGCAKMATVMNEVPSDW